MAKTIVIEMSVNRDKPDDRPLGKSGEFLTGTYGQLAIAEFSSLVAAEEAAQSAPNRRPGTQIWLTGQKRAVA